jgi:hypothetical protein
VPDTSEDTPSAFGSFEATPTAKAVVAHFAKDGLTMAAYLNAASAQPPLLTWDAAKLIDNIETVSKLFTAEGLTRSDYLQATLRQPQLFCQKPATLIGNIEGVLKRFAPEGLSTRTYLRAAVELPSLFVQRPSTLISNFEGVVEHFAAEGLTTRDYLQAALKQPQLFAMKPSTVIGHLNLIESLQEQGLLPIGHGKSALFAFVLKNPRYLTLADDNFHLREIASRTANSPTSLFVPRGDVEAHLSRLLGHADLKMPAPKIHKPESSGADFGPHSRNLLLRALIHEGYIKGKTR